MKVIKTEIFLIVMKLSLIRYAELTRSQGSLVLIMIALFFFFKLRVLECGDSRRNIVLKQSHLASHAKTRVVIPNFHAVEFMVEI